MSFSGPPSTSPLPSQAFRQLTEELLDSFSRHSPCFLTFSSPSRLAKAGLCQCLYAEVNLVCPSPSVHAIRHRLQAVIRDFTGSLEPQHFAWLYDKLLWQTGGDLTLTSLKWWLIYMNWELRYEIFHASPAALEHIKGIYYGKLKSVEID